MQDLQPRDVVIVDGARTPVGTFLGSLSKLTATQLGTVAARAALARSGVDASCIDAVFVGNVIQSDKDAAYLARHIALHTGVPIEAPALTVNRLCGSGLESIVQGAKALMLGEANFVLAGGAESMSRVPYTLRGAREGWGLGRGQMDDMLWSALTDDWAGCQIGQTVEHLAKTYNITREEADTFAVWSHQRAAAAQERGRLASEIVPVEVPKGRKKPITVERDEGIRPGTSPDVLAKLRPLYGAEGVNTPGNSSGLHDAAAMVVMTTWEKAQEHNLTPLGRVVSWADVGVDPLMMGIGPVAATQKALAKASLSLDAIDVIEINDSFAVQYLAVERDLGLDREKVNPNGGGLSLGHPMGATGTRLVLAALYELREQKAQYALASLCIGGGQGMSLIVERIDTTA